MDNWWCMALVSDTWRYMIFRITALFTALPSFAYSKCYHVGEKFAFLVCLIHLYRSLLEAVHLCTTVSLTVPLSTCFWYKMYHLLCYSWICCSIVWFWKYKARFRVSMFLSWNISSNYTLPRNANFFHFFSKPVDTHLVVGMCNGSLSIRHHIKPTEDRQKEKTYSCVQCVWDECVHALMKRIV